MKISSRLFESWYFSSLFLLCRDRWSTSGGVPLYNDYRIPTVLEFQASTFFSNAREIETVKINLNHYFNNQFCLAHCEIKLINSKCSIGLWKNVFCSMNVDRIRGKIIFETLHTAFRAAT